MAKLLPGEVEEKIKIEGTGEIFYKGEGEITENCIKHGVKCL